MKILSYPNQVTKENKKINKVEQ